MPSGKDRKEDTWKESDLKKALKPGDKKKSKDDRKSKEESSHKSDDKREHREWDDNKKRRDRDDLANGEVDHRRTERDRTQQRDRDPERDRDRERGRDRERDKDRERRKTDEDRDKERTRERDRDRDKRREKDPKDSERSKEKSSSDRPKESDRSRERRKEKEDGDKQHDKEKRRDRDAEKSKDKEGVQERRDRHRERDRSKERQGEWDRSKDRRKEKSSEDREREQRRDRDTEKKGERDRHERSRGRDTNREGRKDREDKDRGKERTKDRDKDKERDMDKSKDREKDRERPRDRDRLKTENRDSKYKDDRQKSDRHDKNSERKSKHEENARETRHDDKKNDRRERREDKDRQKEQSKKSNEREKEDKIKRREDELMQSLKQEEELRKEHLKFRSNTTEEADVIEEDVDQKRKASLQRMPSISTAEEIHDEENDGYDYDDDDFEDYDEDFEDDDGDGDANDIKDDETSVDVQDPSRMQELLQAINAENEGARASSREGREQTKEHTETQKDKAQPTMASHGRINFVAAKQKQISDKVASRTRIRGQELMRLIDLDVAAFDIFDLPPLNEYELYIKNFGRSDTKQAYVQCNEDNVEKEIQTEEIETRTKWTQNPASDAASFGDDEDDIQEDLSSLTEKANIDSLRLSKFLQRAAQTCLILLEESISEQSNTQFKERKDMTCTDSFMQLSTKLWYLEGRPVKCVHISPVQTHVLLTAYGPVADKSKLASKLHHSIQEKGLVCVWNTNEPSEPQKILICESTPRCCCLSPSKATLAFAGLEDGSLVAWDLREPSSMHHLSKIAERDNEIILRSPTFSTAGVLKKDESHLSPVVSLIPLVMPGDRLMLQEISAATSIRASGGANLMSDMLGLSFQLASLEENAAIYLWVVVELDKTNNAGSESDLGLSPGGKIKLIKSSSIALQSPVRDFRNNFSQQALILRFLPHDPNHVYVGTDRGYVLHCDRHGGRAPPKTHGPDIDNIVRIAALDFSPWELPCMLAGSDCGDLWLFNLKNEFPLLSWPASTNGNAILSVRWSYSRPGVFYVLDSNSSLHVWDLLKSDKGPVAVEKFKHGRVTCFELSSDYSASGIGIPGRNPELVLVYESGAVEVHRISSVFTKASGDELDRFASYLDSVL